MLKQTQVHKSTIKVWLLVGMLLSLAVIGVGGCSSTNTTSSPATPAASGTQPSSYSQQNQGQAAHKPAQNPALNAVLNQRPKS